MYKPLKTKMEINIPGHISLFAKHANVVSFVVLFTRKWTVGWFALHSQYPSSFATAPFTSEQGTVDGGLKVSPLMRRSIGKNMPDAWWSIESNDDNSNHFFGSIFFSSRLPFLLLFLFLKCENQYWYSYTILYTKNEQKTITWWCWSSCIKL